VTDSEWQLVQHLAATSSMSNRWACDDSFFDLEATPFSFSKSLPLHAQPVYTSLLAIYTRTPTIRCLAQKSRTFSQADENIVEICAFGLVPPSDRSNLPNDLEDAYPLARLQAGMFFMRNSSLTPPFFM